MLTSVVRRVTRPAVEKRSMFENEKLWMLANMACRRFAAGGAGLGLSIVHDMVERSYGTIAVQARPGGGTIFTVRFPHFDLEEDET